MRAFIKLLRLKHSVKNVLILLPLFFGGQILAVDLLIRTLFAVVSFTCACSFVYIVNDLWDIEKDRLHPVKCKRPLASGEVPVMIGIIIAVAMIFFSYIFLFIGRFCVKAWICLSIYVGMNILYSVRLKTIALVDIAILTSGFVIRIIFGSAVTGIPISDWMYLTIFAASLFMALGKRRNELKKLEGLQTRAVLKKYNYAFLDKCMYVSMALALMFYSLWTISEYPNTLMIATIPIVVFICLLYSLIIEGESHGDPVEVILSSPMLIALSVCWMMLVGYCLYF